MSFSAQIRTNLKEAEIQAKVNKTIRRLGLDHCQDQRIGGWFTRGVSGGERKRTSIGYELITDPSIMLLDEPTSGLDSHNALKIIDLLKTEANRGMAVLCTIHQPSAQILSRFDRIVLLSEGYTIFSGAPKEVTSYFQKFGLRMTKFCNPADKLIAIAS